MKPAIVKRGKCHADDQKRVTGLAVPIKEAEIELGK
jgi:hypothetical protein